MGITLTACNADHHNGGEKKEDKPGEWIPLFNGKNLDGWTPKFVGHDAGVNYKNTFVVEDGLLRVKYDQYAKWEAQFGHLFYKSPFSHYILRCEYRFVGEQAKGGPGWAFRNNGLMVHSQAVSDMGKNQKFPHSIEVQLLGGSPEGKEERSTMNLCTPGTHVVLNNKLEKRHCINSGGPTFHGDQWVKVELEVRGSEVLKHWVNGKVVMEYKAPQLNDGTLIEKGYIALQAESHPTDFRNIEIKILKE